VYVEDAIDCVTSGPNVDLYIGDPFLNNCDDDNNGCIVVVEFSNEVMVDMSFKELDMELKPLVLVTEK
jgi:hypothetical protein